MPKPKNGDSVWDDAARIAVYNEGAFAKVAGTALDANPYSEETDPHKHATWAAGWGETAALQTPEAEPPIEEPAAQPSSDDEQQDDPEGELQQRIDAATGQSSARDLKRRDSGQIMAELTDHIQSAMGMQEEEIARVRALLDEIRQKRSDYARWTDQIHDLDRNAEGAEKELLAALQAATFAKALMTVQRAT